MPHIPKIFIDELLTRVDIVNVIEAVLSLKKKGNNYVALCPFHNEKTPSFSVSEKKQIYHCFGCGASGNAISFMTRHQHMTFVEAVEFLANHVGMRIPHEGISNSKEYEKTKNLYKIVKNAADFYKSQLQEQPTAKKAIEYLKNRGLNQDIIKQFHIGYAPPYWDNLLLEWRADLNLKKKLLLAGLTIKNEKGSSYDRFRDRIMFPILSRYGKFIGFGGRVINSDRQPKYLNSPETPIFHKGNVLYGLYQACQHKIDKLIVVEGYMDVIALTQHGISCAVATLGTATTTKHIKQLFRIVPEVIFCFDGDFAGQKAAWKALAVILPLMQTGWHPKFMFLKKNDDPDTLIRREGKDVFDELVNNANNLSKFMFEQLNQKFNIEMLEGRAAYAKFALTLIQQVNEPLIQTLLLEKLSKHTSIHVNQLKASLREKKTPRYHGNYAQEQIAGDRLKLPLMLTARLLQSPDLIQYVDDAVLKLQFIGSKLKLFKKVVDFIKNSTVIVNTGLLMEYFRGTKHEITINKLINHKFVLQENIKIDITDCFIKSQKKLLITEKNAEYDKLLYKSKSSDQTDTELKRKKLKRLHEEING